MGTWRVRKPQRLLDSDPYERWLPRTLVAALVADQHGKVCVAALPARATWHKLRQARVVW
jgi:hypothetical protein